MARPGNEKRGDKDRRVRERRSAERVARAVFKRRAGAERRYRGEDEATKTSPAAPKNGPVKPN